MNRQELIELVRRLMSAEGTEEENDRLVEILERSVPHPRVLDLIYHPQSEGLQDGVTAEQVVDAALAYKPFAL
ncbi:bacteriocin immunity protein [Streptomyces sp. NY05-11A]|uniref:bacteriocin immunity protein n=1 Tax=Streptomyces soliscabiei TaxID=588897 RepID=UPI0029A29808|nr:bacteriocin immunity protein [Streptomyces sp. NY05-11A]MDX2678470.1 bacteriocin immunity protein [Streptomyces sp. NY05-11A]